MWLSRQMKPAMPTADADLGVTTIAGEQAGVVTRGEVRALTVYGPGGYAWRPAAGDRVLVLKAGGEQESLFILGMEPGGEELSPGEVRLSGGSSSIRLGSSALDLNGNIRINGTELDDYIIAVAAELLSGGAGGGV